MKKLSALLLLASLAACGDDDSSTSGDPTSANAKGTATFTTWGEEYIEDGIPVDTTPDNNEADGFADGWSVKYSKFLVVFGGITVADIAGNVAASQTGSLLVDNTKKNPKDLVVFKDIPAKAYQRVSYQFRPADAQTTLVGEVAAADKDFMVQNGYSLYVEGTGTKGSVTKSFKWGFAQTTTYSECKAATEDGGTEGVVIVNGANDTSQLTTHGDHFFYNRLLASPDSTIPTLLRFETLASADDKGDKNGEITFDELANTPLDLSLGYDPSGLKAVNMKEFVTQLSRTVGHYRGEGECNVTR
jgi:hypothetical protein